MAPKKKYHVQASTITNTYTYCRVAALNALKTAKAKQPGYFYFLMMAGVFASFTVEGYLNHLGQKRVRDWTKYERKLGPYEKLLILRDLLNISLDFSSRPFQTLKNMLNLRNALAHAKTTTERIDCLVDNPGDEEVKYPQPDWKKLCEVKSVERMVEDAEKIVRYLSIKAGFKKDPFLSLGEGNSGINEVKDAE